MIDFNEHFTLNKRNDRFILPLMKTTKYKNTIFFKSINIIGSSHDACFVCRTNKCWTEMSYYLW